MFGITASQGKAGLGVPPWGHRPRAVGLGVLQRSYQPRRAAAEEEALGGGEVGLGAL
jgi:hypothetical protein